MATQAESEEDCESEYRTHLPREQISSDDFSIWSVLKTAIGRELTKIPMPVVFNEPLSFLQRMAEFMEYSPILDMAAAQTDSITRMEYVAAFAVSGLASNWQRVGKPFNPLLGETYELNRNNYWFVSEQVSHHPPISAFHAESKQFRFHGSIHPKLKFWGRSVEIQPRGVLSVELPQYDEVYTWSNVNCCVHNVIVGKLWIEQYGTMSITNHRTGEQCTLLFKPAGWFSKELHRLEGFIVDKAKVRRRFLYGRWTDFIRSTDIHSFEAYEKQNSSKFKLSSVDCSASKPTHSPAHSPRRVLSKLNSLSTPFRSHTESTAGDLLNVDESTPAEYGSTGESGGEVPLSLSAYSIDIPNSVTLWQAAARPAHSAKYYHFTWLAMSLNQRTSDLQSLCPTDSRLRPDILALEEGNIDLAAGEKNRLEEKQREARKPSHKQQRCWTARFFKLTSNPHVKSDDWMYLGNYWHDRQAAGPDIF